MDFEVKNANNRFYNIILDIAEERISELEDKRNSVECNGDIRSGKCGREAERQRPVLLRLQYANEPPRNLLLCLFHFICV